MNETVAEKVLEKELGDESKVKEGVIARLES